MWEEVNIYGFRFLVLSDDPGISLQIKDGLCRQDEVYAMEPYLKPGTTQLDIGSNLGIFVLYGARRISPGTVYAIEPHPQNIATMEKSLELNEINNVKVYQMAIGGVNGTAEMTLFQQSNWGSILERDKTTEFVNYIIDHFYVDTITVPMMTLDAFTTKENIIPDIIRMDVEGHEYQIFQNGERTVTEMPLGSMLQVEFHTRIYEESMEHNTWLVRFLWEHGFDCVWEVNGKIFGPDIIEMPEISCNTMWEKRR
jgi:FkbM family methyltransferase